MTKRDIDWRAVNAALAEVLFGYEVRDEEFTIGYQVTDWDAPWGSGPPITEVRQLLAKKGELVMMHGPLMHGYGPVEVPDYSGTWAGMGEVVEAMEAKGWLLTLHTLHGGSAQAWFNNVSLFIKPSGYVKADTPPRAVALAALHAVAPDRYEELIGE
jgi:hypothetical protein